MGGFERDDVAGRKEEQLPCEGTAQLSSVSSSGPEGEGGGGAYPPATYARATHLVAAECGSLGAASLAVAVVHEPGTSVLALPARRGGVIEVALLSHTLTHTPHLTTPRPTHRTVAAFALPLS